MMSGGSTLIKTAIMATIRFIAMAMIMTRMVMFKLMILHLARLLMGVGHQATHKVGLTVVLGTE